MTPPFHPPPASRPYPRVGLPLALAAAFRLYRARGATRGLTDQDLQRLLGQELLSGDLTRLLEAMNLYGLTVQTRRTTALTPGAVQLFTTDNQNEFRSMLHEAAMRPEIIRELSYNHTARLVPEEVDRDLKAAGVSPPDRQLILGLLVENAAALKAEQDTGSYYRQFRSQRADAAVPADLAPPGTPRPPRAAPNLPAWPRAGLLAVGLLIVAGGAYVAFRSARTTQTAAPRQVAAPVPEVELPVGDRPAVSAAADVRTVPEPRALSSNAQTREAQTGAAPTVASQPPVSPPPAAQTAAAPATTAAPDAGPADTVPAGTAENETRRGLTRGRTLARLLLSNQLGAVWNAFSPAVREEWGGLPAFTAYRQDGLKTFGAETAVLSEAVRQSGGVSYYTRTATFQRGPKQPWTLIFGLNPAGQVVAFNIVAAGVLPGNPAAGQQTGQ